MAATSSNTTSAPRRLTAKGERTRARIVETAADLMFARGVAGTTLEDVQTGAGVGVSQLYHYFEDKNALVRAVIAYRSDMVVGPQEAALARIHTIDGLRAWADAVVAKQQQLQCRGGCPIGSLGSELAEHDADARTEISASFERWSAAIHTGAARDARLGTAPARKSF